MAETEETPKETTTQRPRLCRYYLSWNGCREGDHCTFKHDDDIPICKYYNSRYGCWNGRWCRFRHSEPEEKSDAQHFYQELNQWLGPSKLDESSCSNMNDSLLIESAKGPNPEKKYVSRATQTKSTPEFIYCGECGEEFKSGKTLQQSLERHYIHMMASADFYHVRFFRRHPELRRNDALCAACGEVFSTIESLLQHMGARVSGMSQETSLRVEHQNWFKQLVQPFVYRDLEVLETDEDLIQRLIEVYFVKPHEESSTLIAESEEESPIKTMTKAKKKKAVSKPKPDANNNEPDDSLVEQSDSCVYCDDCGEILDGKESERKLMVHYEDMLTRAERLHMWIFRNNKALDGQAICRVCRKTFRSPAALMQHIGSKKKHPEGSQSSISIQHAELLSEIAEVFLERDLGVENCTGEEQVVERLTAIVTPAGRRKSIDALSATTHVAETGTRRANVDDTLEMARYFCQVNKWQARMSYPEYVRDDHERTRNNGFTVGEVEHLASKGLGADSPAAFKVLNTFYKKTNARGPLRSQWSRRRQSKDVGGTPAVTPSEGSVDKEKQASQKPLSSKRKVSSAGAAEAPSKGTEKPTVQSQTSVTEAGQQEKGTVRDMSPKPRRKKQRRRSSRGQISDDKTTDAAADGKREEAGQGGARRKRKPSGVHAKRLAILKRKREAREKANQTAVKMIFQVDTDGRAYIQVAPTPDDLKKKQLLVYAKQKSVTKISPTDPNVRVFIAHEDGLIDIQSAAEVKGTLVESCSPAVSGKDSVDGNVAGKKAEIAGTSDSVELVSVIAIAKDGDLSSETMVPPVSPDDAERGTDEDVETGKIAAEDGQNDIDVIPLKAKEEKVEEGLVVSADVTEESIKKKEMPDDESLEKSDDVTENPKIKEEMPDKEEDLPTPRKEATSEDKLDKDESANKSGEPSVDVTQGQGSEIKVEKSKNAPIHNEDEDRGKEADTKPHPLTPTSPGLNKSGSVVLEQVRKIEQGLMCSHTNSDDVPSIKPTKADDINNNVESDKKVMSAEMESCGCIQTEASEEAGRTAV